MVESSRRSLRDEKHPSTAKMIFLDLTRSLGPNRLSWITSLTLSNKITAVDHENWLELQEMASTMAYLTKVLINSPSLRVKYNMHHFCRANLLNKLGDEATDISIFTHGIVVSSVTRGDALENMWPTITAVVPIMRESYERRMSTAEKFRAIRVVREAPLEVKRLWDRIRFFPNPDIVTTPRSSVSTPVPVEWELRFKLWAALFRRRVEEGM
jgi:hypothetical protein